MADVNITVEDAVTITFGEGPPGPAIGGGGAWDDLTGTANHVPMAPAPTGVPTTEGTLSWNADDHTLNIQTDIADVVQQVGQEQMIRVRNVTGSTLSNGDVVYLSGASGQRATVAKASASNDTHVASTIGIVTADIANNAFGFVTTAGLVRGLTTGSMVEGNPVYLGDTAGTMTQTPPTSNIVRIGWCVVANNGSGAILTHVDKRSVKSADVLDATDAATANTLAKRDADGAFSVKGMTFAYGNEVVPPSIVPSSVNNGISCESAVLTGSPGYIAMTQNVGGVPDALAGGTISGTTTVATGTTWSYADASAKTAHLDALGAGATGKNLLAAGTVAEANAVLAVQSKKTTGDQSISSTTWTDVTNLTGFSFNANTAYRIEFFFRITNDATPNIQIRLTHPNNTPVGTRSGAGTANVGGFGRQLTDNSNNIILTGSASAWTGDRWATGFAYVEIGGTGGTGSVQFAQVTSTPGTPVSILTGSRVMITEI